MNPNSKNKRKTNVKIKGKSEKIQNDDPMKVVSDNVKFEKSK